MQADDLHEKSGVVFYEKWKKKISVVWNFALHFKS